MTVFNGGNRRWLKPSLLATLALSSSAAALSQTNSSSIAGNVVDSTGAYIPNAKVTATQKEQSVILETASDEKGHFKFPEVVPGTYTITISLQGFKTDRENDLVVASTSQVSVGDIHLQVGGQGETVTVSAEGQHLVQETAERSENVTHEELQNVPIDQAGGRSYLGALATVPGVQTFQASSLSINVNGGQIHQNNLTLDGILNVDAGGNGGPLVDLNADNVGELHVSTHNGDSEYGRQGTSITVTTASGSSTFHGQASFFHRHEGLNANSWANKRTGVITPRPRSRLNEIAGNFSGPVVIPHVLERFRDKMFFFIGEDVQSPLQAQSNKFINLPTYAESLGDFSQSHDKNGAKFYLTDYTAPGTGSCTAANTVANPGRCFVSTSSLSGQPAINVIPLSKQNSLGQSIVKTFGNYIPTAGYLGYAAAGKYGANGYVQTGQNAYNYSSAVSDHLTYRQDIYRLDFNPTPSWQTHIRWANLVSDLSTFYGARFSDTTNMPTTPFTYSTPGHGLAVGITKIFSPTTTNELTFGFNLGKIRGKPDTDALTKTALGVSTIPLLYNSSVQDGIPDFEFGGSRLSNSPQLLVNDAPYSNANTAIDILDNFTKIIGSHQVQAGVQFERLRKDQYNAGFPGGVFQFGDDVNNSYDTSNAYANALTGVYDTFAQQSAWRDGKYRYGSVDFYGQDTWKVSHRLTLVAGLRVQHWTPFYDSSGYSLNFDPTMWNAAAAPRLYLPTATAATDPGIPGSVFPKAYAGLIVPGSGNNDNGLQAQEGSALKNNLGGTIPTTSRYLFNTPKWLFSPHAAFTYDAYGNQKTILRAGVGAFYDRYAGNTIFNMINNPPSTYSSTVYYGTFGTLASSGGLNAPPSLLSVSNSMKYPVTWQLSADVQQELFFHTVMTIAYVGSRSSHLEQNPNLNYIPYGTTFLPQNQNPASTSTIPGANAYSQVLLEKYRGFGAITNYQSGASSNFNSLQVTASRRYTKGLFLSASYIFGKTLGTTSSDSGAIDFLGRTRDLLYAPTTYDRRHIFTATFMYPLPAIFRNPVLHSVVDGWQVSGITYLWSGTPFSIGETVFSPGTTTALGNQNLTGSYTETARVQLVGNPFLGTAKSGPYNRINPAAFAAAPQGNAANPYANLGVGMRSNQFYGPGIINTDLSLLKQFTLLHADKVRLQLRADAFNVFNHVNFTGFNTTATFVNGPNTVGTPVAANIASGSNTGGFGGVSGAAANRVVALMGRIQF